MAGLDRMIGRFMDSSYADMVVTVTLSRICDLMGLAAARGLVVVAKAEMVPLRTLVVVLFVSLMLWLSIIFLLIYLIIL